MNEDENEFVAGRVVDVDSEKPRALFVDWIHSVVRITERPEMASWGTLRPRISTNSGHVFLALPPALVIPDGMRHASSVLFWSKTETEPEDSEQGAEFTKAIRATYAKSFASLCLNVYVNPKEEDFQKFIHRVSGQLRTGRALVHFTAQSFAYLDGYPFRDILNETSQCGVHIIDCDFAGTLSTTYRDYLEQCGEKRDFYAFFSCGARQVVPRTPGLPSDLFSSCLIAPAKTALLWHSWHYFCFRTGALCPLTIEELNNVPRRILTEIRDYLKRIVEAMIMEFVIEKKLSELEFIDLFRRDDTISDLVVGFILAVHIMDFFNVHPISIPSIPDVSKHVLWNSLELKLDAVLLELSPQPNTVPNFMEQEMQTVNLLFESEATISCFLSHVNFLPLCLLDKSLTDKANVLLCKLMETNKGFLRIFAMFPLLQALLLVLKRGIHTKELFLNLTRMAVEDPYADEILGEEIGEKEIQMIFEHSDEDAKLWSFVFFTICLSKSAKCRRSFREFIPQTMSFLSDNHDDIRLWSLLCLSQCDNLSKQDIERLILLVDDSSSEIRIAAIYCILSYLEKTKEFDAALIIEKVSHLENDLCPAVRCQLISILSYIFVRNRDNSNALKILNNVVNVVARLTIDPYTVVNQMARNFGKASVEGQDAMQRTEPLAWFFHSLTAPLSTADLSTSTISSHQNLPIEVNSCVTKPPALPWTELKKGISFELDVTVSSNFAFTEQNELLFGTTQGQIHTMSWGIVQRSVASNLANKPITHLQYLPNSGAPLLLVADDIGGLFALTKRNSTWEIFNSFRIMSDTTSRDVKFECSAVNKKLLTYARGEEFVRLFDLERERYIGVISPKSRTVMSASALANVDNVIAVCGDSTELYDTRVSTFDFVLSIAARRSVYDGGVVQNSPFLFAVCLEDASVSYLDWRFQHPLNCFKPIQNIAPVQPLCFATHQASTACAVGHTKGATVIDISGEERFEYPMASIFSKQVKPVHEVCFHPRRFSIALTQTHTDIVSLIEA